MSPLLLRFGGPVPEDDLFPIPVSVLSENTVLRWEHWSPLASYTREGPAPLGKRWEPIPDMPWNASEVYKEVPPRQSVGLLSGARWVASLEEPYS
jgi:hypothetical protein